MTRKMAPRARVLPWQTGITEPWHRLDAQEQQIVENVLEIGKRKMKNMKYIIWLLIWRNKSQPQIKRLAHLPWWNPNPCLSVFETCWGEQIDRLLYMSFISFGYAQGRQAMSGHSHVGKPCVAPNQVSVDADNFIEMVFMMWWPSWKLVTYGGNLYI